MTTWAEFGTGVWAAAIIPLLLLVVDKVFFDKKESWFGFLSLALAALVFAGHVQLLTYVLIIIPLYLVWLIKFQIRQHSKLIIKFILHTLLGLGLGAIQLLPTFEFLNHSIRTEENYAAGFNYGLTPLSDLVRLWIADFYGHPSTYNHWSKVSYHEYSSFLGTITLPLVVTWLSFWRRKLRFFSYLLLGSLCLLISQPLSQKIFSLPIPLLTYSSASRLLFLTVLAAAVLIALSVEQLHKVKFSNRVIVVSLGFLLLTGTFIWTVPNPWLLKISLRNSVIPVFGLLLLTFSISKPKFIHLAIPLLVVFLGFDLGRYFHKYNPFVDSHLVFPQTPVTDYLASQPGIYRIAKVKTNLLPPNTWMMYGLESIEGYDPLRDLEYNRFFNLVNRSDYLAKPSRYGEIDNFDPRYLDALNVKYLVSLRVDRVGNDLSKINIISDHNYKPVFSDGTVVVYESPTVKERAYFQPNYKVASNKSDLAQYMMHPSFDPRSQVILAETLPITLEPKPDDVAKIVYHKPNEVLVSSRTAGNNLLVLSDAYDEGWNASIDGNDVKIYRANGALRAIVVPPGEHQISFKYWPKSVDLGIKLAVASLAFLFVSIIVNGRRS